jgi:hypothetical protein
MAQLWTPGRKGHPLRPPWHRNAPVIARSPLYVERHPTRYRWRRKIQPLIRRLYREYPDLIHINTYVDHPEGYHRQLTSFDVWGLMGRGSPIIREVGDHIFNLIWNDPGEPYIDWIIWQRKIWVRAEGFWPRPFGNNPFEWHDDHVHVTFMKGT